MLWIGYDRTSNVGMMLTMSCSIQGSIFRQELEHKLRGNNASLSLLLCEVLRRPVPQIYHPHKLRSWRPPPRSNGTALLQRPATWQCRINSTNSLHISLPGMARVGKVHRQQNKGRPIASSNTNSRAERVCFRAQKQRHQGPMQDNSRRPVVTFVTNYNVATFCARVSL